MPTNRNRVILSVLPIFWGFVMTASGELAPPDGVPLAAAIAALRAELTQAWTDSQNQALRFRVAPVELTLEAAVTWTGKGTAGIKWWLLELGGEVSREKAVTQTIKLTLDPVTLDRDGNVVAVYIDAADETNSAGAGRTTETALDAEG